jgi:hypothetical protein
MGLFITIFFCIRNFMRAKAKELNAGKWALFTFLAVIAGWFIGCIIMVVILLIRYPELGTLVSTPGATPAEVTAFLAGRMDAVVADLFLLFCGLGGYLFVRHLLINKPEPGKSNKWPDGFE